MSSDKRESKSFLDSGCQAADSRRIPGQLDSGFRILFFSGTWISDSNCSWDLGSLSCVPHSKKKTQTNKPNSGIPILLYGASYGGIVTTGSVPSCYNN